MNKNAMKNFLTDGADKCKILVVGDVMLDKYYFGEVTRISPEAPVPVTHVLEVKETLGGAANVAHNLALLNCKTFIAAQIGYGGHGEVLLKKLLDRKVNVTGILRTDSPTTTKIRVISGHQQMIRLDFEDSSEISGNDAKIFLSKVEEIIPAIDAVILSDYGKGICTEEVCQKIIQTCRAEKKFVVVDPKGDEWKKYSGANFITPNLKELNEILPKKIKNLDEPVESAAKKVVEEFNLSGLIVTRSAEGLTITDGEKTSHIKAKAQEVFDVSGAGDTVISVFTAALAGGLNPNCAAYLANVAAGVVVAKVGTYAVSREELLNALEN